MSYSSKITPESLTPDIVVNDAIEVSNYLRERFGKDKIFLLGHSWGSYLGVKVAEKNPNLFYAYIGVGQVSNQKESDRIAYEYMLKKSEEINDVKAIEELKSFNVDAPDFPTTDYLVSTRHKYLNKYGLLTSIENGTAKNEENFSNMVLFKGYTISDKIAYLNGMMFSLENLFPVVLKDDLTKSSTKLDLPVYIMHGSSDYTTVESLAKNYFDILQAPSKEYYLFEKSAHVPMIDENEKFIKLMQEIKDANYN